MLTNLWDRVAEYVGESTETFQMERSQSRINLTAEVFTPTALVVRMLRTLPEDALAPGKTVLDPACGDGQFLVAAKAVKMLRFGMSESAALEDLYGVDIMPDNVAICRARLAGGTIVVGDTLNPANRVPGQCDDDYELMKSLFGVEPPAKQLDLWEALDPN